jgi:lipid-binding SYLF domain-containing protein
MMSVLWGQGYGRRFVGVAILLECLVLWSCATRSPMEEDEQRREIDAMSDAALATLVEKTPQAQEVVEQSIGYAVANMKVTKIPFVGGGSGTGVIVDKRNDARTYVKVSRFDVGGGLGAQGFKAIVLFDDPKLLDRAMSGVWHVEAGAEAAGGEAGMEGRVSTANKGYRVFKVAEGGVAATVTLRMIRARPFLQ